MGDHGSDFGEEFKRNLFRNIVTAGGTTLIDGFEERLEKELKALAPEDY